MTMTTGEWMRHVAAMAAVLAMLAVGCTQPADPADEADGGGTGTSGTATEAEATDDQAGAAGEVADQQAGTEDVQEAGDAASNGQSEEAATDALLRTEPLARTEHPLTDLDGTLEIELRAEEVGDLLRVAVTFTPRGIDDERTSIADLLGAYASADGISGRLIDAANLLEYQTVRPAVRHGQVAHAYVDHPTTLVFYFGRPVEPMETFDFLLDFEISASNWPGFVDLPYEFA